MLGQGAGCCCGLVRFGEGDLQAEPFVDHKAIVFPLVVKGLDSIGAIASLDQLRQRGDLLGHVARRGELFGCGVRLAELGHKGHCDVRQTAFA